jgi:hypothetical protein
MHLHVIRARSQSSASEQPSPPSRARRYAVALARLVSALALLATGAIHIQQYAVADYRVIPTIGTLFLLNFVGGTVFGLYLLVPGRAQPGRFRRLADQLVALGGLGLATLSLIALFVSEQTSLFGFMEHGYRLEIVVAIVSEAVAAVALVAFLMLMPRAAGRSRPRKRGPIGVAAAGGAFRP